MHCRTDHRLVLFALLAAAAAAPAARGGPLRVIDPSGEGVAGAAVTLYRVPVTENAIERAGSRIRGTTTGDDGAIEGGLPQIAPLVVVVDHPDFAPRVAVGPPESLGVVRLEPGGAWTGHVRGADGSAVNDGRACVGFDLRVEPLRRQLELERCAPVEAGRFTVGGVPEGVAARLRIVAPGYLPAAWSEPPPADGHLVLEPGVLVAGRVVGARGEGLGGAQVRVVRGESTESQPDGAFAVRAPRLPAEVGFRAPGHRQRVATVATADPDEPLVVALTPGPTLAARVLGGDGRRPEGVVATVLRYEAEPAEWRNATRLTVPDPPPATSPSAEDGEDDPAAEEAQPVELDLDLPGAGEYRLVVSANGYSRYREPTFVVDAAGHVDLGLLQLSTGAGVIARLVDARTGEPVPGVLGQLSPTGTAGVLAVVSGAAAAETTDAEGRLRVVGQESGAFELQLAHRDYASRVVEVQLEHGEVTDLGTVWLGPGTEVRGRVTDRPGDPRPGLRVRLIGSATGSLATVAERTTGDDGRFAPARLGAGEYRIEVHADKKLLDQGLTVGAEDAEVELDLTVGGTHWRGRVIRGEEAVAGGSLLVRPLTETDHQRGRVMVNAPGMEPQLLGGSGGTSSTTVSRQGLFELRDAPTGLVLVTYLGTDGRRARERLYVPADAAVHQDIRLTDSQFDGVVLDAERGATLQGALVRLRDPLNIVVAEAVSGPDGTFRLTGFDLASGYQLEAELRGYRPRLLRDVPVGDIASPLQVLLEPAAGSSLEVRLQRSDGSRPSRATISLFSEGGWMLRSSILDPYGEIVFDDVAPGRYFLLWHDPLTGTGASPIHVGQDEPTDFARVLAPGAPLVLDCGERCAGTPLAGLALVGEAGVDLTSHLPAISPALRFSQTGQIVLGRLQPGSYIVRTWLDGRQRDDPFVVRPGEPVAVDLVE